MLTLRLFVQITSVKHSNIFACLDPLPQGKSTVRNTKVYGLAAAFVNLGRMFGPYGTQKRSAVVRSRTVHGYAPEIRRLFFVACLDYAAVKSSTVRGSGAYGFAIFLYSLPNVWSYAMEKSRS